MKVKKVVEELKDGRAAGVCSIRDEMVKADGKPDSLAACSQNCYLANRYHSYLPSSFFSYLQGERGTA